MLHNLYVKNLALIDEIEVEFTKGLNILTGETGAGNQLFLVLSILHWEENIPLISYERVQNMDMWN